MPRHFLFFSPLIAAVPVQACVLSVGGAYCFRRVLIKLNCLFAPTHNWTSFIQTETTIQRRMVEFLSQIRSSWFFLSFSPVIISEGVVTGGNSLFSVYDLSTFMRPRTWSCWSTYNKDLLLRYYLQNSQHREFLTRFRQSILYKFTATGWRNIVLGVMVYCGNMMELYLFNVFCVRDRSYYW